MKDKQQAGNFRVLGVALWVLAFVVQIVGIWFLFAYAPLEASQQITLIAILVVDLVLLLVGSSFWKKANRFDPPSRASSLFVLQSQLGVVMAFVCFLPVLVVAIIKKEFIVAVVAAVALLGGSLGSADYHPASQEQYAEQATEVETLTGKDFVYWTKSGNRFHLYSDCRYINTSNTSEIFEGSVADARHMKNITSLCSTCKGKVMKEKGITEEQLQQAAEAAKEAPQGAGQPEQATEAAAEETQETTE